MKLLKKSLSIAAMFIAVAFSTHAYASEVSVTPGRYYGGDVVSVPYSVEEAEVNAEEKANMDILAKPHSFERSRELFRLKREDNFKKMRARFSPDPHCNKGNKTNCP